MNSKIIKIAKDFTRFPGGRFKTDGPWSGQQFREEHLKPAFRDYQEVVVQMDDTLGFSSSFLEEAFGGLIRVENFRGDFIRERLNFQSSDPAIISQIRKIIDDAINSRVGMYTDPKHGNAIQMRSGRPFYPWSPRHEDVRVDDIIWALSRKGRYGCHSLRTYTVLEHEIRGCDLAMATSDFDLAIAFLVHDSSEAILEDMPRPIKVNLPDYQALEKIVDSVVIPALLPTRVQARWHEIHPEVKRIDNLMLAAEQYKLMASKKDGGLRWYNLPDPPEIDFEAPVWDQSDFDACLDYADRIEYAAYIGQTIQSVHETQLAFSELQSALLRTAWIRRYKELWNLCANPTCEITLR